MKGVGLVRIGIGFGNCKALIKAITGIIFKKKKDSQV